MRTGVSGEDYSPLPLTGGAQTTSIPSSVHLSGGGPICLLLQCLVKIMLCTLLFILFYFSAEWVLLWSQNFAILGLNNKMAVSTVRVLKHACVLITVNWPSFICSKKGNISNNMTWDFNSNYVIYHVWLLHSAWHSTKPLTTNYFVRKKKGFMKSGLF